MTSFPVLLYLLSCEIQRYYEQGIGSPPSLFPAVVHFCCGSIHPNLRPLDYRSLLVFLFVGSSDTTTTVG